MTHSTAALAQGLQTHFSPAALGRLGAARVGIAGAGGLGSNVAALLVRSGVRHLVLVDGDSVRPSNLNRQFYWPEDVGRPKVEALRARLLALEPELACAAHTDWLTPQSAPALFSDCLCVAEALDEAGTKAAICSALLAAGFFVAAASGICGYGLPPLTVRRLGSSLACVGDFHTAQGAGTPPLAPRVMQAAALQADLILARILEGTI